MRVRGRLGGELRPLPWVFDGFRGSGGKLPAKRTARRAAGDGGVLPLAHIAAWRVQGILAPGGCGRCGCKNLVISRQGKVTLMSG